VSGLVGPSRLFGCAGGLLDGIIGCLQGALFFLCTLWKRNGGLLELDAEPLLVAALEDTGTAEQRSHGVAGLSAHAEPVVRPLLVDVETAFLLAGSILPDDLDELAIARALRVGDDNAVRW